VSPRHHPSADILASYATGTLDPGFGLVVGVHVGSCAKCRAQVSAFEATSGAALNDLPQAQLASGALAQTLARLDQIRFRPVAPDTRPLLERLPLEPKRWVAPGVWVAAVNTPRSAEDRVYVLSVGKSALTARHEHSGAEFCVVLKGAYRDELGVFAAGDFAFADSDVNHQPVVEGDQDCICLFATEGRLKPHGLIGRLAFELADV